MAKAAAFLNLATLDAWSAAFRDRIRLGIDTKTSPAKTKIALAIQLACDLLTVRLERGIWVFSFVRRTGLETGLANIFCRRCEVREKGEAPPLHHQPVAIRFRAALNPHF